MNIQDYKGVFVFAQQVDNVLSGIALKGKRPCQRFRNRSNRSSGRQRCKGTC